MIGYKSNLVLINNQKVQIKHPLGVIFTFDLGND